MPTFANGESAASIRTKINDAIDKVDGNAAITSVNIDGGSIDGTTIGGTTPAAITGTTITGTSFVTSGNMTFGNNDKAIFGAGSDLQIYHDGTNSRIYDTGTGDLRIQGTNLRLQAEQGENFLYAIQDGAVTLYYDNSAKLATTATGVDVTGTVTADGLTVENTAAGSTASPQYTNVKFVGYLSQDRALIRAVDTASSVNGGQLEFLTTDATNSGHTRRMNINRDGDISFYEDTGTTPKFFWDASAEALGIGTSSPAYKLDITEGNATGAIRVYDSGSAGIDTRLIASSVGNGGSGRGVAISLRPSGSASSVEAVKLVGLQETVSSTANNASFAVQVANTSGTLTEHLRINSAGNVGIGTSSPAYKLDITEGNETGAIRVYAGGSAGIDTRLIASSVGNGGSGRGVAISLRPSGSASSVEAVKLVGLQETASSTANNASFAVQVANTSGTLTERLRITSTGNVGIGTTAPAYTIDVASAAGIAARFTSATGGIAANFKNNSSGTALISFTGSTSTNGVSLGAFGDLFVLNVNGSERMRIDSSGNVGIGTTAPNAVLNVSAAAGAAVPALGAASSHLAVGNAVNYGTMIGTLNNGVGYIQQQRFDGNATAYNLLLQPNGGSVGIGTSSPNYRFHVADTSLTSTTAGSNIIGRFQSNGSGADVNIQFSDNIANASQVGMVGGDLYARTNNVERMRVLKTGNVGIGTTSPATTLDVNGDVTITDKIIHSGDTNTAIRFPAADTVTVETAGSERMRIDSSGNVGIGTSSPVAPLDVYSASALTPAASFYVNRNGGTPSSLAGFQIYNNVSGGFVDTTLVYGNTANSYLAFGHHNGTAYAERLRIDSSGNVLIGGTAAGTSSAGNLVLVNGTAPTGNVTNGITLFAEDVSSSSELKVRDEAGNVTTLSPHNFDLIPEGPSEDMAWSYYSERDGKRINVDMLKAIRILEQLSGEKLVHIV